MNVALLTVMSNDVVVRGFIIPLALCGKNPPLPLLCANGLLSHHLSASLTSQSRGDESLDKDEIILPMRVEVADNHP
jgi:hypothetical protein